MNSLFNMQAGMSRKLHRGKLTVQKYSPEILLIAGLGSGLATLYFAIKAARNIDELNEDVQDSLEVVEEMKETLTPVQYREELGKTYIHAGLRYTKLLGPALGAGVLTVSCILGSHNIMHRRQVGLIAAYNAAASAYRAYRKNVIAELGPEADKQYQIGAYTDSEQVTEEDGTVTTEKVTRIRPNPESMYARFFDESCNGWRPDPDVNLLFLKAQQQLANDMLHWDGHIFLNDVYKLLGMSETPEGQLVGWMYNEDPKAAEGDNCVDFDIFEIRNNKLVPKPAIRDRNILVNFNVDGVIFDKIG